MLVQLSGSQKLPKIVVSSLSLGQVPVAVLKTSDEIGVSARLESLELGMKRFTETIGKLSAQVQSAQPAPAVTVSPPTSFPPLKSGASAPGQGQPSN